MASNYPTPGVYINEVNGFANSVVPIATAVPAFIGYTPRADYQGESYYNKPQKISSFMEFQAFFMLDNLPPPADPARQYSPEYYLVQQKELPTSGEYLTLNNQYYSILPDPSTIYYLYNSVRLFYQNGGGDAYIVAVGPYGPPSKKPATDPAAPVINPNVQLADLQRGLALLKNELEPTMYICPEATLLSVADNGTLMQGMLLQAQEMGTAMCIFDVIGGANPDPILYTQDIQTFRDSTGNTGLEYGASYYPFIGTTIMQQPDIDFTNLFGGDTTQLAPLLNPPSAPNAAVAALLEMIQKPPADPMTNSQLQAALLIASPLYSQIVTYVLSSANTLPPSGAIAGVYTVNDNTNGVWGAPANVGIVGAASLPIRLSDSQQETLNIDAVSGKSVNAIRFFNGQGILIWGARTLDGNSQDWRYVSVRRTMTFLEQSVKLAARQYIFSPNTSDTWLAVKSMITSFLMGGWRSGGLQGSSPADAFQVNVGLGSTMTADDVLNGYLRVSVLVATVRPAEFLVIMFQQEQAKSA
ncbi:phage tail sheath protein [Pseudomonas amygdali pv. aesculi str. 0893_23]|uniref:phage tail sheath family protein n=1 Tax=Pseudomonas syringae group genomosp. 2 TaxID=251698 RepID=UPI0001CC4249|nr:MULTISPECIES: phage tail sheath C-terminal domain-containing protein [Pseudomonas syringae group genomosp. 2]EGH02216.1 phage tail sheath protein [Pseudomonas amygdali pv. aesculi str. 0893_23]KPW12698.1 Phage tail sheath protein [Pseudomonas amygdali pv. aesculi]MCQ3009209.1 phage tail sheath subtilisin-like domain-containing protein [Pseudomonas savastanoi]